MSLHIQGLPLEIEKAIPAAQLVNKYQSHLGIELSVNEGMTNLHKIPSCRRTIIYSIDCAGQGLRMLDWAKAIRYNFPLLIETNLLFDHRIYVDHFVFLLYINILLPGGSDCGIKLFKNRLIVVCLFFSPRVARFTVVRIGRP